MQWSCRISTQARVVCKLCLPAFLEIRVGQVIEGDHLQVSYCRCRWLRHDLHSVKVFDMHDDSNPLWHLKVDWKLVDAVRTSEHRKTHPDVLFPALVEECSYVEGGISVEECCFEAEMAMTYLCRICGPTLTYVCRDHFDQFLKALKGRTASPLVCGAEGPGRHEILQLIEAETTHDFS